ncbi:Flp family type IVb pilin [Lignipirellula cremea]|uniref:Uncharacterized protein n=1 Tax=Lignipirellula cremea TaxID=2528010 RepID=A0A518E540_9BACT|nr:hypothetical protein [Lignipirellula cremea]QDU99212.1 hypothetical protein Pla8534_71250 [Lignipirellula cremea]
MQLLTKLWRDEQGAVNSIELILIGTVLMLGLMVGLAAYRDSIINELADTGRAVGALNQSYSFATDLGAGPGAPVTQEFGDNGMGGPRVSVTVSVADSSYLDATDFCDDAAITRASAVGVDEDDPAPMIIP